MWIMSIPLKCCTNLLQSTGLSWNLRLATTNIPSHNLYRRLFSYVHRSPKRILSHDAHVLDLAYFSESPTPRRSDGCLLYALLWALYWLHYANVSEVDIPSVMNPSITRSSHISWSKSMNRLPCRTFRAVTDPDSQPLPWDNDPFEGIR